MTKLHRHLGDHHEFTGSHAEYANMTRRQFLQTGTIIISGAVLPYFIKSMNFSLLEQGNGKRIYIAPDDHTDLFWTADLATYEKVFVDTLDYYLDLADATQNEVGDFQSRWNCDGSFWVWTYEKYKTKAEF